MSDDNHNDDWDEEGLTVESTLGVYFREQDTKPCVLEQVKGPGAPRELELRKVDLVVGRSTSADIPIDSVEVSRRHMTLKRVGKEFVCADLESRNGIYLNGVKIHSATLREGDSIQLGNVVFVFHEGS